MKPLRFIHIPKNARSSIEEAGRALGLQWGKYDRALRRSILSSTDAQRDQKALQHLPWTDIPAQLCERFVTESDWFAVVRDPQQRVVSEFFGRFCNLRDRHPQRMNATIRKNMVLLLLGRANNIKGGQGHWLPQAHFTHPGGRRVVRYLLAYKHLQEEWQLMLEAIGQAPLQIDHLQPDAKSGTPAQRPRLDMINRLLVRLVYREDYRLLREHWQRNLPRLDDVSRGQ